MDEDLLLSPIMYLDEDLLRNMHSLVLSGYIQTRSIKLVKDKTLTGRTSINVKENEFNEDKTSEDERQGYKSNNTQISDHSDYTVTNDASLEDKNNIFVENQITKTYATFSLHTELVNKLNEQNSIKYFDNDTLTEDSIQEGEYINIRGILTSDSINSYLDAIITLLTCFQTSNLNKLIDFPDNPKIDFDIISCILSNLKDILNPCRIDSKSDTKIPSVTRITNTQDLIINYNGIDIILNVNTNSFRNNSIYDKINCPCSIFGKVVKVVKKNESISMLRQTGQYSYYEELLKLCEPYLLKLRLNGIPVPSMPKLKYNGLALVIVPISISM